MRDEAAKVLGRSIDEFGREEMLRCCESPSEKSRLLSDLDSLSHEDKKRLLVRMKSLFDESTKERDGKRADLELDRAVLEVHEAAKALGRLEGLKEGMREAIEAFGRLAPAAAPAPIQAAAPASLAEASKRPVSWFYDDFFKDQGVSEKTEREYRTTYRKMTDTLGDLPVGKITDDALRRFFDRIPSQVSARGGRTMAAAATVTKHATALKSFFSWAAGKKLCSAGVAAGLKATKAARREEKRFTRRPFTKDELTRFFDLPLFTGARSPVFLNKPGKTLIRDHRFFFPIVALMTGGRRTELAQALIGDIKLFEGTSYLLITTEVDDEDAEGITPAEIEVIKHLKTENAKRCVPIHPVLRKIGFLDYVERRRGERPADSRIFPVYDYSKLYNERLFVAAGVKTPTTAFHSFRHNYKDMIRGIVGNEELQDRLMGHAPKGAGGGYGSPLTKPEERVFFGLEPAIPLVHLYSLTCV